ncbi:MAG: GNAT family N-acetyltransferase [Nocardioidaceae bacterium]
MRIRPATAEDAGDIARVWEAAWHDAHDGRVPQELVRARPSSYFLEEAPRRVVDTLVAADGQGRVLGMVIVRADEVVQLMVAAEARGSGAGSSLMEAAERRIAGNHSLAWLAVVDANVGARAFYERRGWSDAGELSYAAPNPGGEPVAVPVRRYVKALDGGDRGTARTG